MIYRYTAKAKGFEGKLCHHPLDDLKDPLLTVEALRRGGDLWNELENELRVILLESSRRDPANFDGLQVSASSTEDGPSGSSSAFVGLWGWLLLARLELNSSRSTSASFSPSSR